MEKRAVFPHRVLPYVLLAPQIAVTLLFFFWPASQALYQSLLLQDAFGLSTRFAGLDNFRSLSPTATIFTRWPSPRSSAWR